MSDKYNNKNEMNKYSFKLGYEQLRRKDVKEVRERIMSALGIATREGFYPRLRGEIEPRVSEAKAIEEIFAEYGIKKVWGNPE